MRCISFSRQKSAPQKRKALQRCYPLCGQQFAKTLKRPDEVTGYVRSSALSSQGASRHQNVFKWQTTIPAVVSAMARCCPHTPGCGMRDTHGVPKKGDRQTCGRDKQTCLERYFDAVLVDTCRQNKQGSVGNRQKRRCRVRSRFDTE